MKMQLSLTLTMALSMMPKWVNCFIDDESDPARKSLVEARDKAKLTARLACAKPKMPELPEGTEEKMAEMVPKGKVPKVCPQGMDKDGVFWDKSCIPYPTICEFLPGPEEVSFSVFSEMFPCWALEGCVYEAIRQIKDETPSSLLKCAWDFVAAFLYACYPGYDPVVLYDAIKSGQLATGGMAEAQEMMQKPPSPF